jgi:hypothetical protein
MATAALIEELTRAGISLETIEKIKAATRRGRPAFRGDPCPGCGQKIQKNDYVCGDCSILKARSPRLFWHRAREFSGLASSDGWLAEGAALEVKDQAVELAQPFRRLSRWERRALARR